MMTLSKAGFILVFATVACLAAANNIAYAQKWEPFQFKGSERYEYKISWLQDEKKEIGYAIEVKETNKKNEDGDELLEVSYTVKGSVAKSNFAEGSFETFIEINGYPLNFLIFNPVYLFVFEEIELKDGDKTNFSGMGSVKIEGKEKIAGKEGFVCRFYQKDDDEKEQLAAEWIVDPALGLPLRTKMFDNGELQSQCELQKYNN